jgi:endogenous inhibitor of DNA gyrase (YacG/DUF329 family)
MIIITFHTTKDVKSERSYLLLNCLRIFHSSILKIYSNIYILNLSRVELYQFAYDTNSHQSGFCMENCTVIFMHLWAHENFSISINNTVCCGQKTQQTDMRKSEAIFVACDLPFAITPTWETATNTHKVLVRSSAGGRSTPDRRCPPLQAVSSK